MSRVIKDGFGGEVRVFDDLHCPGCGSPTVAVTTRDDEGMEPTSEYGVRLCPHSPDECDVYGFVFATHGEGSTGSAENIAGMAHMARLLLDTAMKGLAAQIAGMPTEEVLDAQRKVRAPMGSKRKKRKGS